jgi:hypothetical protein
MAMPPSAGLPSLVWACKACEVSSGPSLSLVNTKTYALSALLQVAFALFGGVIVDVSTRENDVAKGSRADRSPEAPDSGPWRTRKLV